MQRSRRSFGLSRAGFTTAARICSACARALRRADVIAAGAMAPLPIDTLGKAAAKHRLAARRIVTGWNPRIAVVAKNAFIGNQPPRDRMPRIEPGAHGPIAALFRIPPQRRLDERPARGVMEIGAG